MNRKKGFLGAGLSTVLLVFVMLCLIVFAVLSLATARGGPSDESENGGSHTALL